MPLLSWTSQTHPTILNLIHCQQFVQSLQCAQACKNGKFSKSTSMWKHKIPPSFTHRSLPTSLDFLSFTSILGHFLRMSIEKARAMTRHQRQDGICGSCNKMLPWKISIGVRISKDEMSRADFYQYRLTKVASQRNVFITHIKLGFKAIYWPNLMILIIKIFGWVG